ncbi:hypothetical protein THAOC_07594 [Thalassiosira oceanica]|uniref:Uncharacterized protein n=1 Tax=Thalassiosira oceanica TaxID=159749 RepID=K0SX51_THAOC|nr:hypothetical protein THAOC_07594 [Thalassiosira oceanica]|eukprot:EJK71003.1 hypothetical protein THAOC_07594 [Thalassiosira oceanica]
MRMAAGECDIWILLHLDSTRQTVLETTLTGIGGLSMSLSKVSLCKYTALSGGVQLRGQNRLRSRDQRPYRMPESESAEDSSLECTPPLPPCHLFMVGPSSCPSVSVCVLMTSLASVLYSGHARTY